MRPRHGIPAPDAEVQSFTDTDYRQLGAQILATHTENPTTEWDAPLEMLDVAKTAFSGTGALTDGADDLLAGIARILVHGPFPAVRLHAATVDSRLPDGLRPGRPVGPPEEDVLLHALAHAAQPGDMPWPYGVCDPQRVVRVVTALTGVISCRMVPLRAVVIRYLLAHVSAADQELRRWLLRRAVWLVDPRCDDPVTLLLRLTGTTDPLVVPLTADSQAPSNETGPSSPFMRSDWAGWREATGPVQLAGRIHALRVHRRVTFADLRWDGRTAQLALNRELDTPVRNGDLIAVRGKPGVTRTGQDTVFVDEISYHQPGAPTRTDHADLSAVLGPVRRRLADTGFTEAMTPVLTDGYFGGSAAPFTTWAAAAGRHQYLRVTTELDLLGVIAAGTSRCYEIAPSFRNEGLRGQPTKEFPMLEAYCADLDLDGMTDYVVRLLQTATSYRPQPRTVAFDTAFQELSGVDPHDAAGVRRLARRMVPVTADRTDDPDILVRRMWRSRLRGQLPGLVLITAIPGPSSPLIAGTGRSAERVWLYAEGTEIAEISRNERNPDTLARAFNEQFAHDPYPVHRDYRPVIAMFDGGLPPCVGVGLSLTRLDALARQTTETAIPEEGPAQ